MRYVVARDFQPNGIPKQNLQRNNANMYDFQKENIMHDKTCPSDIVIYVLIGIFALLQTMQKK